MSQAQKFRRSTIANDAVNLFRDEKSTSNGERLLETFITRLPKMLQCD